MPRHLWAVAEASVTAVQRWPAALGAKLGTICGGLLRTGVDPSSRTAECQAAWTSVDSYGRRLDIYGSGGWEFESLRACRCRVFVEGTSQDDSWEPFT